MRVNLSMTMPRSSYSIKKKKMQSQKIVQNVKNVKCCTMYVYRLVLEHPKTHTLHSTLHQSQSFCYEICVTTATMVCVASHHSYHLLHFVTICDLCSYDFSEDPFNVGCHTCTVTLHRHRNMKNCFVLSFFFFFNLLRFRCRLGTNTTIHRLFYLFSLNWIQTEFVGSVCSKFALIFVSHISIRTKKIHRKSRQCGKSFMRKRENVSCRIVHRLP